MFRYQALDTQGKFVEGQMEAISEAEVVDNLLRQGFTPLKVIRRQDSKTARKRVLRRAPAFDLSDFFENLYDYLDSGLSIDKALALEAGSHDPSGDSFLHRMVERIRQGESLSQVMADDPEHFSAVHTGIVRVGEETDSLVESLRLLAQLSRDMQGLREKIRSALAYPAILALVMMLSMLILFLVVIPKFKPLFAGMGVELDGMAQAVIGISDFMQAYGLYLALSLPVMWLLLRLLRVSPATRRSLSELLLRLPLVGDLMRQYNLYMIAMVMQVLLRKKITVIRSLEYVQDALSSDIYRERIGDMIDALSKGETLGASLSPPLFPEHFIYIVNAGEETGRLDASFAKLAGYYYKQLNARIAQLMTYAEPAIIMLLGASVGLIVVSMLKTLLSINELVV